MSDFVLNELPLDQTPANGGFIIYEVSPGVYRRATVQSLRASLDDNFTEALATKADASTVSAIETTLADVDTVAQNAETLATGLSEKSVVAEQSKGTYDSNLDSFFLRLQLADDSFVTIPFAEFVAPLQRQLTFQQDGVPVAVGPKTLNFTGGGAVLTLNGSTLEINITGQQRANLEFTSRTLTDYTGLVGWWDMSDASTITESGGSVSQVNDKSTSGVPFVQATGGSQPTLLSNNQNGLSVLSFNGTNQFMTANASGNLFNGDDQPFTIYAVLGAAEVNATMVALGFGLSTTASMGHYLGTGSGAATYRFNKRSNTPTTTTIDLNTVVELDAKMHCITISHSGTTTDVWVDGYRINTDFAQNTGPITTDRLAIGAWVRNTTSSYFNGRIGEIALFTGKHTDTVIKEIQGHLMRKWFDSVASADFIFTIGQSNMVGKANPSTYAGDLPAVPTGAGLTWLESSSVFIPIRDPIGLSFPYGGPMYSFANKWWELTGRSTFIVPRAMGSTALLKAAESVAASGFWQVDEVGNVYDAAVAELNQALAAFGTDSIFTINQIVVLWAQGESDATALHTSLAGVNAVTYQAALAALFNALKTDVTIEPGLFLISLLGIWNGTGDREAAYASIRQAQIQAADSVTNAYVAWSGAADFTASDMYDDNHYTQTGYNTMGEGLATGGAPYAKAPLSS